MAISFAPILVKALAAGGLGLTPIAMWRTWLGSLGLLAVVAIGWRRVSLPPAARVAVIIAGISFAADLFVWHRSIALVGAGMATILGNTQVFWSALLGRVLYGERISPRLVAGASLALVGVALLSGIGTELVRSSDHVLGIVYGLATGVVYAAYIVALRHGNLAWQRHHQADDLPAPARACLILGWALLGCASLLTVIAWLEGDRAMPSGGEQLLLLAALAVGVQILGWLFISLGMARVAAARGSLVLLLQPALAALWGALWFDESLGPVQLLGGALVLVGIYLGSVPGRRRS